METPSIYSILPPPYDIVGDIHNCYEELVFLFFKLGYKEQNGIFIHPQGRIPIFIGDITDRGPDSIRTMNLVLDMVENNKALFISGNHDIKLARWMKGRNVQVRHGMEVTTSQLQALQPSELKTLSFRFIHMVENSPSYLILDGRKLVVAHAGIKEEMIGTLDKKVSSFVLYGDVTGKFNEDDFPERRDWAANYKGRALVVYGHTSVDYPVFINNTINIDAGCAFGGSLCALRYPEREIVCQPAKRKYYQRQKS